MMIQLTVLTILVISIVSIFTVNVYGQGNQKSYHKNFFNYTFPLPGKSECSQPQDLKWEYVDDTPLGNIEAD